MTKKSAVGIIVFLRRLFFSADKYAKKAGTNASEIIVNSHSKRFNVKKTDGQTGGFESQATMFNNHSLLITPKANMTQIISSDAIHFHHYLSCEHFQATFTHMCNDTILKTSHMYIYLDRYSHFCFFKKYLNIKIFYIITPIICSAIVWSTQNTRVHTIYGMTICANFV